MICLDYYLFKLIAGRESVVLGELGWLLTREQAACCQFNKLISTEMFCACRDTSQQESFSALCLLSVTFCHCKVHQKLESWRCAWTTRRIRGMRTKRDTNTSEFSVFTRVFLDQSRTKPRWRKTHVMCPWCKWRVFAFPLHTNPDLSRATEVLDQWKRGTLQNWKQDKDNIYDVWLHQLGRFL